MSSVSVIVPVHDEARGFDKCLSSLADCKPSPELIIVADDASPAVRRLAIDHGAQVISLPQGHGPAYARNQGARAAEGNILLFIDADVVVPPDIVARVEAVFGNGDDVSAIIGSYDDAPGEQDLLSRFRNLLHHYVHQTSSKEANTFWGACGAIRRDVFLSVGGFDETYTQPCVEDIELGYRLKQTGHKIQLHPDLQVKHLKLWTPRSVLRTDVAARAIPWTQLLFEYSRFDQDLNLQLHHRLSVLFCCASLLMLTGMIFSNAFAYPLLVCLLMVGLLNVRFYRFLYGKHGKRFVLGSFFWHWLHFTASGLAFAWVVAHRFVQRCVGWTRKFRMAGAGATLGDRR